MITAGIFILTLILILVLLCLWYLLDAVSCEEDYATNENTTKKIGQFINAQHPKNNILYDLGSGRGSFALNISELCPQLRVTGIDNSLLRILISRLRVLLGNKRVRFVKKDIFATDTSRPDLIYVYIPRILLPKLAEKLARELRPGAAVITSRIFFPDWQPHETILKEPGKNEEDIFIYKYPFLR